MTPLSKPKYGMLTPISPVKGGKFWNCQCECGNITTASRWHLEKDKRRSCGCRTQPKEDRVKCVSCHLLKLRSEFYIRKNGNLSQRRCQECVRTETQGSAHRQYRRTRYRVLKHYCDNKEPTCACCGEDKVEFLAIDHINGGGNKHRKSVGNNSLFRWLKSNNYPEGYRVLCNNCNFSLGAYGYCPHQTKARWIDRVILPETNEPQQLRFTFIS